MVRIRGKEKREGEVGGGDGSHRIVICYVTFVGVGNETKRALFVW